MKNRPFSLTLIGLGLVAWIAQIIVTSVTIGPEFHLFSRHELWKAFLWEFLPYAVNCAVATTVTLPTFGNWVLCVAAVLTGGVGISAWIDYANGGGCMRGLALMMGYFLQCIVAVAGVLLALIARRWCICN